MPANATPKALNAASGGAAGGGADASAGESMTPADGNGLATPDAGAGPDLVPTGEDGLTVAEVEARLARYGKNVLEEKRTSKLMVLVRLLYAPMAVALWCAIVVEAGIGHWTDMGILLGIQLVNAGIGWHESTKAADAVAALKSSLKPMATAKRDGVWVTVGADGLVPGDLVKLVAGAAVPADCRLRVGTCQVDASALTGESLPVTAGPGCDAQMGATCVRGEAVAVVTATGAQTFFGRTAALLNTGAGGVDNITKVLMRLTLALSVLAAVLCTVVLAYLLAKRRENVRDVLSFVIVLLVASIPIAIQIVSTTTLAMGAGELATHGAIVARLAAVEELAGMNVLCSDKTGTLTMNKMALQADSPVYEAGADAAAVLKLAALAARWREPPADALDTMTLGALDLTTLDGYEQPRYEPFDAAVKRTSAIVRAPDGTHFGVAKGAAAALAALLPPGPETDAAVARMNTDVDAYARRGVRCMVVARTADTTSEAAVEGAPWHLAGLLTFLDPPRPDTKDTLDQAMTMGLDVKMITGDSAVIAQDTARSLGLGDNVIAADDVKWPQLAAGQPIPTDLGATLAPTVLRADGFAHVYPEHKFAIVEALRQAGLCVGMTGDGVNDAPALKRAHVGVAVAGATDAARAAADIVLTHEGLSTIVTALTIARQIFRRINNFCVYRIAATLYLIGFFFISVFALPPSRYSRVAGTTLLPHDPASGGWPTFFAIPVTMLVIITVLNDGVFITIGRDHVQASPRPDKWNLRASFLVAAVLAAVPLAASLVALWAALDSHAPGCLFSRLGLPGIPYEKITTLFFMLIAVSSFLTLFAARERGPFWSSAPQWMLATASTVSLVVTTMLSSFWPASMMSDLPLLGLALPDAATDYRLWPVWALLYCGGVFLVQDVAKVGAWALVERLDLFHYRTGALVGMRGADRFDADEAGIAAAGAVEGRLLEYRARGGSAAVRRLERASVALGGDSACLGRAAAGMEGAEARLSRERLARASGLAPARAGDAEAGAGTAAVAQWELAAAELTDGTSLTPEERADLLASLARVQRASASLDDVLEARREQERRARRRGPPRDDLGGGGAGFARGSLPPPGMRR